MQNKEKLKGKKYWIYRCLRKKSRGNKSKKKIKNMYKWFLIEMKRIDWNKKIKSKRP